jgi:hypothetical protein
VTEAPAPVTITIAPLAWRAATLDGAPSLLAVRRVTTPDGQLTQGLVVSSARLREWVEERDPEIGATLVTSAKAPPDRASAPVVLADVGWWVVIDDSAALAAARTAAAGLRSAFLGRFIPISLLALACALLVVLLTARAEKLARQRERFAAAAAHELRPARRHQLYGDMLVVGSAIRKHRDYAARSPKAPVSAASSRRLRLLRLERRPRRRAETGESWAVRRRTRARPGPRRRHRRVGGRVRAARWIATPSPASSTTCSTTPRSTPASTNRRIISVTTRPDTVEITVADRGPGLPSLRRRRFQPFAAASATTVLPASASRLQSLAQAMGGELTWRDQSPGATFVVTLPAGDGRR